jgi:hypothetical protein
VSYHFTTIETRNGRTYAETFHHEGPNATQATRDHNAAMGFHWTKGTDASVSDLYNHAGESVRHGARQHQPRPDTYRPIPMPPHIAAALARL